MTTTKHRYRNPVSDLWTAAHRWHGQEPTAWYKSLLSLEVRDTLEMLEHTVGKALEEGKFQLIPEDYQSKVHIKKLNRRKFYLADLAALVESIQELRDERPEFLFGNSRSEASQLAAQLKSKKPEATGSTTAADAAALDAPKATRPPGVSENAWKRYEAFVSVGYDPAKRQNISQIARTVATSRGGTDNLWKNYRRDFHRVRRALAGQK